MKIVPVPQVRIGFARGLEVSVDALKIALRLHGCQRSFDMCHSRSGAGQDGVVGREGYLTGGGDRSHSDGCIGRGCAIWKLPAGPVRNGFSIIRSGAA